MFTISKAQKTPAIMVWINNCLSGLVLCLEHIWSHVRNGIFFSLQLHPPVSITDLQIVFLVTEKKLIQCNLSLRTPLYYGQFVWSQKCQKPYIPYLYNTDTTVKRTLSSVPLVSVLKRSDCIGCRSNSTKTDRFNAVLLHKDHCINHLHISEIMKRLKSAWKCYSAMVPVR